MIKRIQSKMCTKKIYDNLYMVQYEVKMKIPGIFKYLFHVNGNIYRMQTAVNETVVMFRSHMNRAPWAIEKVQKTFLCDREEVKIEVPNKDDSFE